MTTVLMGGFGLLIVIAIGSVLALTVWRGLKNARDSVARRVDLSRSAIVSSTTAYLMPLQTQAIYQARLMNTGLLDPSDEKALGDALIAVQAGLPNGTADGASFAPAQKSTPAGAPRHSVFGRNPPWSMFARRCAAAGSSRA
jgi:hypothetical protein